MSAHTRIRHARGLSLRLWRALRLRRWMTTESLVEISGGDGVSSAVEARRYLSALSSAGIVYRKTAGNKSSWMLLRATSVRRHPPTDVVQVSCTTTTQGRSCPVGTTAKNH